MKALIFGASGLIGGHLVANLLASNAWNEVIVAGRKPLMIAHPKLKQVSLNFTELESYHELFKVDVVFSCIGTTKAIAGSREAFREVDFNYNYLIAKLAADAQVPRYLLVSAYGADANSVFFYSQVKGQLEEAITELPLQNVIFMQPSLLLGERKEFRLAEQSFGSIANRIKPLWRNLRGPWWPVDAEAVAKAMAVAALLPQEERVMRWQYVHIMAANK